MTRLRSITIAVFLAVMGVELLYSWRSRRGLYTRRDTLANLGMYAGNALILVVWARWMFLLLDAVHEHALFADWLELDGRLGPWSWVLLVVLEDLCFYVFHRASHRIRILWASHENHHSSPCFNLSVALRQTWTPFLAIVFWLPLAWLGFDPTAILVVEAVSLSWQALTHTQLVRSLGPLDLIFNTPKHHRVHHGSDAPYIDKNFGGVLIVWDRLFGTFAKEGASITYGIHGVDLGNPLRVAFREWRLMLADVRRTRSLLVLVMPPEWRPKKG